MFILSSFSESIADLVPPLVVEVTRDNVHMEEPLPLRGAPFELKRADDESAAEYLGTRDDLAERLFQVQQIYLDKRSRAKR